jgi:hypothetical protein
VKERKRGGVSLKRQEGLKRLKKGEERGKEKK